MAPPYDVTNIEIGMTKLIDLLISLTSSPNSVELKTEVIELLHSLAQNNHLPLRKVAFEDSARWGAQELRHLFEALDHTSIISIDLSKNKIDNNKATIIAQALSLNTRLEAINLSDNLIGKKGGIALAQALHSNTSLKTLHLNDNILSPQYRASHPQCQLSLEWIKVLKKNSTLEVLDLRNTQLDVSNLIELCKALLENYRVKQLIIGEEGGFTIIIHQQICALATFLDSVDTRLLGPPLLTITQKPAAIIDNQYPEKPFSIIWAQALLKHMHKIEQNTKKQAVELAHIFPIPDIGGIIGEYVTDPRMQAFFLTSYRNSLHKTLLEPTVSSISFTEVPPQESPFIEVPLPAVGCCTLL